MKLLIFVLVIPLEAFAICSTPIIRTNVSANSVLTSAKYNADINTAYNRVNNLPGDCVVDASITSGKIANNAITTSKIADGSITSSKMAIGAIPESGRFLRASAYTSSTTWSKQTDVGSIYVQVVGGGGASFFSGSTNGSASSFGSHCIANGGQRPAGSTGAGGVGGTASNGDINIQGGNGEPYGGVTYNNYGGGGSGVSMLGHFGQGGRGSWSNGAYLSPGGGAGGYCAKLIQAANLNATESVTVGAGGTNSAPGTVNGNAGIVIVYEYAK